MKIDDDVATSTSDVQNNNIETDAIDDLEKMENIEGSINIETPHREAVYQAIQTLRNYVTSDVSMNFYDCLDFINYEYNYANRSEKRKQTDIRDFFKK